MLFGYCIDGYSVILYYSDMFGSQLGRAQTLAFQVFFFQLYLNKKYVEVGISDFAMNLVISKWLRIPKCRQKRQKGQSFCNTSGKSSLLLAL